jgi:hypothetical protein
MIAMPGTPSESNTPETEVADCVERESSGAGVDDVTDEAAAGAVGSQPAL